MALCHATDGPNWVDNTNWLTDAPLGKWYGIGTDADGRVTVLGLHQNLLTGPIPPQLGNLSGLTQIFLYGNGLTGPIPPQLGRLADLEGLECCSTVFT